MRNEKNKETFKVLCQHTTGKGSRKEYDLARGSKTTPWRKWHLK